MTSTLDLQDGAGNWQCFEQIEKHLISMPFAPSTSPVARWQAACGLPKGRHPLYSDCWLKA
jgi:hypothetical protein